LNTYLNSTLTPSKVRTSYAILSRERTGRRNDSHIMN